MLILLMPTYKSVLFSKKPAFHLAFISLSFTMGILQQRAKEFVFTHYHSAINYSFYLLCLKHFSTILNIFYTLETKKFSCLLQKCNELTKNFFIKYSRQCHIVARIKADFYNSSAFNVHFFAGSCISPSYPAGLIKSMWFHSTRVIAHKHLQHYWLIMAFQLE